VVVVDQLEERGLIIRWPSLHDKRSNCLRLTAKGRKVLTQAKAAIHEHEKWIGQKFTKAELNGFIDGLKRFGR